MQAGLQVVVEILGGASGDPGGERRLGRGPAGGDLAAVSVVSWIFFLAVVAVAVVTAWLAIARPPTRTLFRLVMLAALLLAAQLVASGSAIVA